MRRQAARLESDPRPLVLLTPKSLLRHPMAASKPEAFLSGTFMPVLDDPQAADRRDKVTRIILCSGRIAIDLESSEYRADADRIAIVRVEQIAPFQTTALRNVLSRYPNAEEIVWVQEEPKNMGAWVYMSERILDAFPEYELHYVGRPKRASPATGSADRHAVEQAAVISAAFAFESPIAGANGNGNGVGAAHGKKSAKRVATTRA